MGHDDLLRRGCACLGRVYERQDHRPLRFVSLGLYIYSGALVLHTLAGWNLYLSIVVLTFIAGAYTLLGGFGAVVATDVLQMMLMAMSILAIIMLPTAVIILLGAVWKGAGKRGRYGV